MDTTTWSGRAKSVPAMEMERVIAWSCVAFAHLLFAWVATRMSAQRPVIGPAMELVFIQLRSLPSPKNVPEIKQQALPDPPMTAHLKLRPDIEVAAHPSSDRTPARPLQVTTADDRWSSASDTARKFDGISFSRNKLTSSFNPLQAATPTRLHLRFQKELSLSDVVRAISASLFWPPGYTDDPCGGLSKAVEILSTGSTEREHKLLEDAALQQSRYCS